MKILQKRRIIYLFTIALLLVGASGYCFGYYTPERQDATYNEKLVCATSLLMVNSERLLETASLPLFNDLNEVPATCVENAAKVAEVVSEFNGNLIDLERLAHTSQPVYLYNLGRDAARTSARRVRSVAMVKQSRQVVTDYVAMAAFLSALADVRKDFVSITTPLTVVVDLYDYYYRTEELRADANAIDALASRILAVKAPLELATIQTSIAAMYKETAAGYRALADGLAVGNDMRIYAATHRIEAAMEQLDTSIQSQYSAVMGQSVMIKELSELPDKYVIE